MLKLCSTAKQSRAQNSLFHSGWTSAGHMLSALEIRMQRSCYQQRALPSIHERRSQSNLCRESMLQLSCDNGEWPKAIFRLKDH